MENYPKYIALTKEGSSALRLRRVDKNYAIYERPENTCYWFCSVKYNEKDELIIFNTLPHLDGKQVYPISEDLFNKDNGYDY